MSPVLFSGDSFQPPGGIGVNKLQLLSTHSGGSKWCEYKGVSSTAGIYRQFFQTIKLQALVKELQIYQKLWPQTTMMTPIKATTMTKHSYH